MLTPHIDINHSSHKEFWPTSHQCSPSCANVNFYPIYLFLDFGVKVKATKILLPNLYNPFN